MLRKFLFILFIAVSSIAKTQSTLPTQEKDSIFVVNTFEYDLAYGISMFHKFCFNQKTFKINGRIESEVNYKKKGEKSNIITSVVYYYYNHSGQLSSTETLLTTGELQHSINYFYDSDAQKILEVEFKMVEESPKLIGFKKFTHSSPDNYKISYYNSEKKKIADENIIKTNDIHSELKTYKKPEPPNGLIKRFHIKEFENNIIVKDSLVTTFENDSTSYQTIEYTYDNYRKLTHTRMFLNEKLFNTKKFRYFPNGMKEAMQESNSDGKNIKYIGYETHNYFRVYTKPDSQSAQYLSQLKVKIPKR